MPTADSFILGASVSHLRMQGSEPRLTVRVDNVPQPSHRILATQEARDSRSPAAVNFDRLSDMASMGMLSPDINTTFQNSALSSSVVGRYT